MSTPLPSNKQHRSYDDSLVVKMEDLFYAVLCMNDDMHTLMSSSYTPGAAFSKVPRKILGKLLILLLLLLLLLGGLVA